MIWCYSGTVVKHEPGLWARPTSGKAVWGAGARLLTHP